MAQYIIDIMTYDFEGNAVYNQFFVSGTESAWMAYKSLRDCDCPYVRIALIYSETAECIAFLDRETGEEF